MIRAVIVGDSPLLRELLRAALEEDRAIRVVGTAATHRAAQALVRKTAPDVVILDDQTPGIATPAFQDAIRQMRPAAVVMVVGSPPAGAGHALRAGETDATNHVVRPGGRAGWEGFAAALRGKVRRAAEGQPAVPAMGRDGAQPRIREGWR